MAEFNPFDVPGGSAPGGAGQPAAGGQKPPQAPKSPKPRKSPGFLEKLPKNGFGRFVRRFYGLIAAVLVVALVLVIFGSAILTKLSPTWAIGRSVGRTTSAIADRVAASPYQGIYLLYRSLLDGSVTVGASDVALDDYGNVTYDASDAATTGSGQVTLSSDWAGQEWALGVSGSAQNAETGEMLSGDAEAFLNTERIAVRSSLLPDCYGITFETLEDDLRASALPQLLDLTEEDIRMAGQAGEMVQSLMAFNPAELMEQYTQLYEDFLDGLNFESSSEETEVGGDDLKCTAITASLDERDLRDFTLDVFDLMAEDEGFRELMASSLVSSGYTPEEAERQLDQQLTQQRQQVDTQLRTIACDVDLTYYVHDNRLVKVAVVGEITAEGQMVNMDMTMDFGKNPERDDWLLDCQFSDGYTSLMRLTAEYTSEADGDRYSDSLLITVDEGYGPETIGLYTDWNRRTGDLAISTSNSSEIFYCNLLVDGDTATLTLQDVIGSGDLTITADSAAEFEDPDYVNLDQWTERLIQEIETYVTDAIAAQAPSLVGSSTSAASSGSAG